NIWESSEIGITTKIRLFNIIVKPATTRPDDHCHHHNENAGLYQYLPQTRSPTKNYGEEQSSSKLKKTSFRDVGRKINRVRPRNTWRRDLDEDVKQIDQTWGQLERLAQNRDAWRKLDEIMNK
ncbi:hypothetical protein DPMN_101515, partial [Dreissena polymorpha]